MRRKGIRLPLTLCTKCGGVGIFYDPRVEDGRYGQLRLCGCIECRCEGQPPYRYWDDESRSLWCTFRAYRRKMTETNRLFRQADMPERYKWKFIDDFHIVAPDGTPVQLADTAHRYIESLISAPEERDAVACSTATLAQARPYSVASRSTN